jgi:pimeloyl-ACP methyl ester carboxylesterase
LLAPSVRLEHGLERFWTMFRLPPKAVEGLCATIERRFGATVWSDLAADRLARRIECPALIVHDRDDPQVDAGDAELLTSTWKDGRLITTKGLGHSKIVRDPGVIRAAVGFVTDPTRPADSARALSSEVTAG